MKLTRESVLEIYTALSMAGNVTSTTRYNYAIAKNTKLVESEAKLIQKAISPNQRFIEWDNKRTSLCQKYADRDNNGNILKDGGKYVISIKQYEFTVDLEDINSEYKSDIDAQNHKNMEDSEFLKEEVELEGKWIFIPTEDIPPELSARILTPLLCMISEPVNV